MLQVGAALMAVEAVGEELIPGTDIKDTLECRTINKRNANTVPC